MPEALNPKNLQSPAERLAKMPEELRKKALDEILKGAGPTAIRDLTNSWDFWARPNQLPPDETCNCGCQGEWIYWLILAGRGWGKTRTGAEWVHMRINDGTYKLMHLVGATAADARDIMILGESGILATQKPKNRVKWSPTKRRLTWDNGAEALVFSADEPDRLRGLQCEAAWADELAAWRYEEAWSQLQLGLRLGARPRTAITTTPRPKKLVKEIFFHDRTHVTRGTTYENVGNLADTFIAEITRDMEGTRFGRQEIYAEILDESELAYWNRALLDECRIKEDQRPPLSKIVIGVDVAVSFGEESAETGIVVAGIGLDDKAYVLQDASGKYRPDGWARKVVALYHSWYEEASSIKIVAEKNQGYEMIRHTIEVEDENVPVKLVHASKSKITRAEPIATAYERGRVHHVGTFPTLEEQMCTWEAGDPNSPDRMDALVWALTELIVGRRAVPAVAAMSNPTASDGSYWRGTDRGVDNDGGFKGGQWDIESTSWGERVGEVF